MVTMAWLYFELGSCWNNLGGVVILGGERLQQSPPPQATSSGRAVRNPAVQVGGWGVAKGRLY